MAFQINSGISKAHKIVEAVIRDRGIDPDKNSVTAAEGGAAWAVAFGSAAVMIALNPGGDKGTGRLRVVSPIVRMQQTSDIGLFKRLLELNATDLPGVAFGIVKNEIVLVAERGVSGLDRSEVEEMLTIIGHLADQYDDLLVREFGGIRVCDLD